MSRRKIQKKKRKKWRQVYRKFDITQRFNTDDTKRRNQIRAMGVKKSCILRDIMEAVTFYF